MLYEAVRRVRELLARQDIEVPRLEAELLVVEAVRRSLAKEYALAGPHAEGLTRAWLYAHLPDAFPREAEGTLEELAQRRVAGEPLAYIRGHKEFFGLDFLVDPRVLIPRPETEGLVEAALDWSRLSADGSGPFLAADIGTGCGAIAISLAVNLPEAIVYATDISQDALEVAAANARRHGVEDRVRLRRGDLLTPLPHPFPLIVANLPYIARSDLPRLAREVATYEPRQALDGGEQGLDVIGRLLQQAPSRLVTGGCLLLELGYGQGQIVMELARAAFPRARLRLLPDLAGVPRVLSVDTAEAVP